VSKMHFKIRMPLQRVLIMLTLLAIFLPVLFAQNQTDVPAQSIPDWLRMNWAWVALVTSEVMSFLPAKVSGIAKAVFSVLNEIFKKKST
jgi:hypothetical protein